MIPTRIGQVYKGGTFAAFNRINGKIFALVVAQKFTEGKLPWSNANVALQTSVVDGLANTKLLCSVDGCSSKDYSSKDYSSKDYSSKDYSSNDEIETPRQCSKDYSSKITPGDYPAADYASSVVVDEYNDRYLPSENELVQVGRVLVPGDCSAAHRRIVLV